MYAVVQDSYGPPDDVLRLRELAAPQFDPDEVLVRLELIEARTVITPGTQERRA